jgi:hypothetical protein
MGVALVDGTIASKEVQVSFSFNIPDVDAFASVDSYGHGAIVFAKFRLV